MGQPKVLYPFVGYVRRGNWEQEFRTLAPTEGRARTNLKFRAFLIINGFSAKTLKRPRREWTAAEKSMEAQLRQGYKYVRAQYYVYGVRRVIETR